MKAGEAPKKMFITQGQQLCIQDWLSLMLLSKTTAVFMFILLNYLSLFTLSMLLVGVPGCAPRTLTELQYVIITAQCSQPAQIPSWLSQRGIDPRNYSLVPSSSSLPPPPPLFLLYGTSSNVRPAYPLPTSKSHAETFAAQIIEKSLLRYAECVLWGAQKRKKDTSHFHNSINILSYIVPSLLALPFEAKRSYATGDFLHKMNV